MFAAVAPIERVVVGRRYAEVTRIARIERNDGFPGSISIPGLSLALDDASVRVEVDRGTVRSARIALAGEDRGREHASDEVDVREAERTRDKARAAFDATRRQLEGLTSIELRERPAGTKAAGPSRAPIAARLELAQLVKNRRELLLERQGERTRALEAAERRLREAREALAQASTDRPLRTDELAKVLLIELDPSGVSEDVLVLSVTYVVPGARWLPAYTLRLEEGRAKLEIRALVQQKTGEDWKGVRLALSTAERTRWSDLPELQSLRIGRAQAAPRRGYRAPPLGADTLFEDYDAAASEITTSMVEEGSLSDFTTGAVSSRAAGVREMSLTKTGAMPFGGAPGFGAPPPAQAFAPPESFLVGGYAGSVDAPSSSMALGATLAKEGLAVQGQHDIPRARKASGLLANAVGSAVAAFQSAPSAAPRGAGDMLAEMGAGPVGAVTSSTVSVSRVRIEATSLAYGSLRMEGIDGAHRGELVSASAADLYIEASVGVVVGVRTSLPAVLAEAEREAESVADTPPPARFFPPEPTDGFDFSFEADARVDVLSDGQGHSIAVTQFEAPARIFHVTVPRESRDVFRCVEVTSPTDAPLMAGPLDVYEGRDFVLSTSLDTTAPKGKLTMGLGVDPAIKLARNTDFSEVVTGLMRSGLDLKHRVTIEVQNQRKSAIDLEVRERLPSVREREEDIKVEVVNVSPSWEEYDPEDEHLQGGHRWKLTVGAQESKKLSVEYVVRIATKHELVGGNRRES